MTVNQEEKYAGTVRLIGQDFKNRLEELERQIANLVRISGGTKMSGERLKFSLEGFDGGAKTFEYEITVHDGVASGQLREIQGIINKDSAITKQDAVRIMALMQHVEKAQIFGNYKLDGAIDPKERPLSNLKTFKQDLTKFLCDFVPEFRDMEQSRISSEVKKIRTVINFVALFIAAPTLFVGGMVFQDVSYRQKIEKERIEAKAKAEQQVPQK